MSQLRFCEEVTPTSTSIFQPKKDIYRFFNCGISSGDVGDESGALLPFDLLESVFDVLHGGRWGWGKRGAKDPGEDKEWRERLRSL
jgi:hypothetical protein